MTRERALELARTAINRTHACGGVASIADSILAAVAEENEACAKIADERAAYWNPQLAEGSDEIAQRIRARGIPLKVGA